MISVEAQLQSCRPGFAAGQAAASQFVYACFAPEVTCCYAQGLYSLGFVSCLPLVLVIVYWFCNLLFGSLKHLLLPDDWDRS